VKNGDKFCGAWGGPIKAGPHSTTMYSIVIAGLVVLATIPFVLSVPESKPLLPRGDYMVTKAAPAGSSLDNFLLFHDCAKRQDQECVTQVLMDGRVISLEPGTRVHGGSTSLLEFSMGKLARGPMLAKSPTLLANL
jgi:hypothetical protein